MAREHQLRRYQRVAMRTAGSRIGAWFLSHTLHRMDHPVIRVSKGRRSLTGALTGLPIVTPTARGARTGRLHTTPLVGLADGDNVVVIASNWGRPHHVAPTTMLMYAELEEGERL